MGPNNGFFLIKEWDGSIVIVSCTCKFRSRTVTMLYKDGTQHSVNEDHFDSIKIRKAYNSEINV